MGILLLDRQARITYANQSAEEMLALSFGKLLGRRLSEAVISCGELDERVEHAVGHQEACRVCEHEMMLANGDLRVFDFCLSPVAGSEPGVMLELHDLARMAWSEETRSNRKQQESLELVHNILCHELRNPLGGMRGAAQLLHQALEQEDLREYAALIMREIDRLNGLIERVEAPREANGGTLLNLHRLIDDVLSLVDMDAAAEVAFERDFDPSIPRVRGEPDSLKQIFLNLLQNSLQAGADRVRITSRVVYGERVRGERRSSLIAVDIRDNGKGVPAGLEDDLFLPLVSGREDGQGLGLAVSQRIAVEHGGIIKHETGGGLTTFRVLLPIGAADE